MFKKGLMLVGLFLLSTVLAACGNTTETSEITVSNAWIRPGVVGGAPTAAYMVIQNTGNGADRLLDVSADFSDMLAVHETQIVDDVARMIPQEGGVEIPANSTVELRQGGLHVMIIELNEDLIEGQEVELILTFENAGERTIPAIVSVEQPLEE